MKFLQIVVFIASAWFLIWVRDKDPGLKEPLSNGYLIALLSVGAAFVVTIAIIGITNALAGIRRIHGNAKRRRLILNTEQQVGDRRRRGIEIGG